MPDTASGLSRFVQEVVVDGRRCLLHTVTRNVASISDPPNSFLAKNDADVLRNFVMAPYKNNPFFMVVPTWRCTLRCPFCFVMKQLHKGKAEVDRENDGKIDAVKFKSFVRNVLAAHPKNRRTAAHFIGGEALLDVEQCRALNEAFMEAASEVGMGASNSITTNLTTDLDDEALSFLSTIKQIGVSVDGSRKYHEKNRKVWKGSVEGSSYWKTVKNLMKLKEHGLISRVRIQGAPEDAFFEDEEAQLEFMTVLRLCGVKPEQLAIGKIQSGDIWKRDDDVQEPFGRRASMCCSYRNMSAFVVDAGGVYASFFEKDVSRLGDLDTPIEEIHERYNDFISRSMPVLSDKGCQTCPVVAFCWGQCRGGTRSRENPSEWCDREKLVAGLEEAKASNDVLGWAAYQDGVMERIRRQAASLPEDRS